MAKTDWSTKTITLEDGSVNNIIVKDGVLSAKHHLLFTPDNPLTQTVPPNTPTQFPLLDGTNTFFADSDVNLEVQYLKSDNATEEDTDLQTPTPNFPEEIESVGGEIMVSGRNLFDKTKIRIEGAQTIAQLPTGFKATDVNVGGILKLSYVQLRVMRRKRGVYTFRCHVKGGDNPTFTVWVGDEGRFQKYLVGTPIQNDILELTFKDDGLYNEWEYLWILLYLKSSPTTDPYEVECEFTDIMLTKSDTATPYEPYHEPQTLTIPTLNKIGDAQDILHVDRASQRMWVERRYKEIVLDGTENWTEHHRNKSSYYTQTPGGTFEFGSSKCDNFKFINSVWNTDKIGFSEWYDSEAFYIGMPGMNCTQFKQWLSENPTTVIYQLAEPTIEEVEYNEDLLTFYPTTVIDTGVLPTTIKATMKQFK